MNQSNPPPNARSARSVSGDNRKFTVIDEVHHVSKSDRKKVLSLLYLQKLESKRNSKIELRLGYYTAGTKQGRSKRKWIWARYELLVEPIDLRAIIKKAEKKGWL